MKSLYIEGFSGISGNMFLGALFDLGVPIEYVTKTLNKMNLGEYEIVAKRVNKCGIDAAFFNVVLKNEATHEHNHHEEVTHHHEHAHFHGDAAHTHTHEAELHLHTHEGAAHIHTHEHRNLKDIRHIIEDTSLSESVKQTSIKIFTKIALAEAKVHGKSVEEVHFHEVGAIDTIIDVVGTVLALEYLDIEKIYVAKLQTGRGFVQCAHGLMPIPAPATAEILQTVPHYLGELTKELVTPTGAALVAVLAEPTTDIPNGFVCQKIGYGAGTWDLPIPNVVRIQLGNIDNNKAHKLVVMEANLDDLSPEITPYVLEKLLHAGALDVWLTPIVMKKGRLAQKISVLGDLNLLSTVTKILMTETSTLGVRYYPVERQIAEREFVIVELPAGVVEVKVARSNGKIVNIAPEYDDCREIAERSAVPLKQIMREAVRLAEDKLHAELC